MRLNPEPMNVPLRNEKIVVAVARCGNVGIAAGDFQGRSHRPSFPQPAPSLGRFRQGGETSPRVVGRRTSRPLLPGRSRHGRPLRLRRGDALEGHLAVLVQHPQCAVPCLLQRHSRSRSQVLIAFRSQLQEAIFETYHPVVRDHPLVFQAKHPLQIQALRHRPVKVSPRRRFPREARVVVLQINVARDSGSPPRNRCSPPAASS